jgi:RimJ/RimL family protein N-acetyltransferase
MKFKEGKIIIRNVRRSDFKELFDFINKGLKETDFMWTSKPIPKKQEKIWFAVNMKEIKKKNSSMFVAEDSGRIIGNSTVNRNNTEKSSHVGDIGAIVLKKYWHNVIGTRLMEKSIEAAKKDLKLDLITLDVHGDNKAARRFYKKLGFVELGALPRAIKRNKNYTDKIIMYKVLK